MAYDAENRLVEVKKNSNTIAAYTYDGDGRQVQNEVNSVTTLFIGAHYQVEGGMTTKYYFAGGQRIAMRSGGTLSFLLSDHLGSTSLTTDSTGVVVSELRYTAWGEVRYQAGATPTNYTYTGQYSNTADFGLMFYNARWYDPAIGRFAQADTIVPGGVQGLDRYSYTNNNPIRYTDPTGHCTKTDEDYDLCMEQRGYVEEKYSVTIKNNGDWTLTALEAIQSSMEKLRGAIGSDAFAELFTGVTFQIGGGGVADNGMGTTGNRDVILGKDVLNLRTYIERETVHEFAHIWDDSCNDCMSKGLMKATDGRYKNGTYIPGGTSPTDHALKGREEDWAESVTKSLYPSYTKNPLDQERTDYVSSALASPLTNPIIFYTGGR